MNDENERHLLRLLSPYTSTCFPSSKSYESVFESGFNLFFVDAKPQDAYLDLSYAIAQNFSKRGIIVLRLVVTLINEPV